MPSGRSNRESELLVDIIYEQSVAWTFIGVHAIMDIIRDSCPNAESALDHYLDGTGTDYEISVSDLLWDSDGAFDQYVLYKTKLEDHIKSVLRMGYFTYCKYRTFFSA